MVISTQLRQTTKAFDWNEEHNPSTKSCFERDANLHRTKHPKHNILKGVAAVVNSVTRLSYF